jgi:drug/metabolite transporter (DMT)-like permease
MVYVGLDEKDQAMAWLEKAYAERFNPGSSCGRPSTLCAPTRGSRTCCTALAFGAGYGVAAGVLLAAGSIALFAAYHTGANTAVVTTATGLYPMVTVLLAIVFLKERLTRLQLLGVLFAVAAMIIFSL